RSKDLAIGRFSVTHSFLEPLKIVICGTFIRELSRLSWRSGRRRIRLIVIIIRLRLGLRRFASLPPPPTACCDRCDDDQKENQQNQSVPPAKRRWLSIFFSAVAR